MDVIIRPIHLCSMLFRTNTQTTVNFLKSSLNLILSLLLLFHAVSHCVYILNIYFHVICIEHSLLYLYTNAYTNSVLLLCFSCFISSKPLSLVLVNKLFPGASELSSVLTTKYFFSIYCKYIQKLCIFYTTNYVLVLLNVLSNLSVELILFVFFCFLQRIHK